MRKLTDKVKYLIDAETGHAELYARRKDDPTGKFCFIGTCNASCIDVVLRGQMTFKQVCDQGLVRFKH
jgi:hypothetical protein